MTSMPTLPQMIAQDVHLHEQSPFAAAGLNPNQAVTYFTNALDTTTRGVDLVGDYRQDIGAYGNLKYSAGFNWNTTQIDDIHASTVAAQALGPDGGYDRQRQGNLKYCVYSP